MIGWISVKRKSLDGWRAFTTGRRAAYSILKGNHPRA
jgi:hypothetical protein